MSKFYHFSFAHLSFKILLTCVMVVMLCLWVPLPLTTITALARRDSWDTLDGRGRWWPSAKEEKKQKRKVIVLLCFTVTAYHRGLSVLSLCSKSMLWSTVYVSELGGVLWISWGNNVWVCCPLAPWFLSLGIYSILSFATGLPRWVSGKESACPCRRCRFNPWVGKIPGVGMGNLLQYSCLENSTDRGVWWATVHRVTKSQTQLSTYIHTHLLK